MNNPKSLLPIVKSKTTYLFFTFWLFLLLTLFPLDTSHPIFAQSSGAVFTWNQTSLVIPINQLGSTDLFLHTDGQLVTGVDVILTYDSTLLEIEPVINAEPTVFPVNFFLKVPTADPTQAQLRLSSSGSQTSETFTGKSTYVHLIIRPISQGSAQIGFSCLPGSTTDTNIAKHQTSLDIVNCSGLINLPVSITPPANTPTPSTSTTASNSPQSSSSPVTAPEFTGYQFPDSSCQPPPAPSNLTAQTVDSDTILLSWNPTTNATSYSLLYGTRPTSHQIGINNLNPTSQFLVNSLKSNTPYHFALMAANSCGVSPQITISKRTLPSSGFGTATMTSPQPDLTLSTSDLSQLASNENLIPNPTLAQLSPNPLTDLGTATPQSTAIPSRSNLWTQIVIIFLPLIVIFILVSLFMFWFKRRRRQPDHLFMTKPRPSPLTDQSLPNTTPTPNTPTPPPPPITPHSPPPPPLPIPTPNSPHPSASLQNLTTPPPAFASDYNPLHDPAHNHYFKPPNSSSPNQ